MTVTAEAELSPCACGCGEQVKGEWKRGHWSRGRADGRPEPLLTPAEINDLDTAMPPDGSQIPPGGVSREPQEIIQPGGPQDGGGQLDPPAAHSGRDWAKAAAGGKPPKAQARVTATVRKDIGAKVGLMLEMPARIWAARDPICGGAFVEARPEISAAVTDLVCQSNDLVEWFTGQGGMFMLWLNLAVAVGPVASIVLAHHVMHSLDTPAAGPAQGPDLTAFAA
jgi:hypothetical protein